MIRFFKGNFFNPILDRVDSMLVDSCECDILIQDGTGKNIAFRIRYKENIQSYLAKNSKLNRLIGKKEIKENSPEYNFFLNCFFKNNDKNVTLAKLNGIRFTFNYPLLNGIQNNWFRDIVSFESYHLKSTFKFKGNLVFNRYVLDDRILLDVISGARTGYTICSYNDFCNRCNSFNKNCEKLSKKLGIPWKVIRATLNHVYYDTRYSHEFNEQTLVTIKKKREFYLSSETRLPFKEVLIINNLRSSKDSDKEDAMSMILSEEQFESIKCSLYGSRNISIIARYILGENEL